MPGFRRMPLNSSSFTATRRTGMMRERFIPTKWNICISVSRCNRHPSRTPRHADATKYRRRPFTTEDSELVQFSDRNIDAFSIGMCFKSVRLSAGWHLLNLLLTLDRNDTYQTSSETAHPDLFKAAGPKRYDIDGSWSDRDLFYFSFCAGINDRDAVGSEIRNQQAFSVAQKADTLGHFSDANILNLAPSD